MMTSSPHYGVQPAYGQPRPHSSHSRPHSRGNTPTSARVWPACGGASGGVRAALDQNNGGGGGGGRGGGGEYVPNETRRITPREYKFVCNKQLLCLQLFINNDYFMIC